MTFLIATIVILLGVTVFSFTISSILLITFFGIPVTYKMKKMYIIENLSPIRTYSISLVIQIIILLAVTLVFYVFFRDSFFISLLVGYGFGTIGILSKLGSMGMNVDNMSDYLETNKRILSSHLKLKEAYQLAKERADEKGFANMLIRMIRENSKNF